MYSGFAQRDVYGLQMSAPPEIAAEVMRKRTRDVSALLQKVTADNIAQHVKWITCKAPRALIPMGR